MGRWSRQVQASLGARTLSVVPVLAVVPELVWHVSWEAKVTGWTHTVDCANSDDAKLVGEALEGHKDVTSVSVWEGDVR